MLFLAVWAGLFLALGLARQRFTPYAVVPAAVVVAWTLREAAVRRWPRRAAVVPAVGVFALLAVALPTISAAGARTYRDDAVEALRFVGAQPGRAGSEAILAPWNLGHLALYEAGRPVVASPFGTEGGPGAMEDLVAFLSETRADGLERLLEARRIGWVVLSNPVPLMGLVEGGAEPPVRVTRSVLDGQGIEITPAYLHLVAARLYHQDGGGTAADGGAGVGILRLVHETPPTSADDSLNETQIKVFERVEGAVLEVDARRGAFVAAETTLETDGGREVSWAATAVADESGRAHMPYATGPNGRNAAGPWVVTDGARRVAVVIGEEDVVRGRRVGVALVR